MTARRVFAPWEYQGLIIEHEQELERSNVWAGMGLGKTGSTPTALEALYHFGIETMPSLVIAPLRVAQSTWPDECEKWVHLSGMEVVPILGDPARRAMQLRRDAPVFSINYENVPWLIDWFKQPAPVAVRHGRGRRVDAAEVDARVEPARHQGQGVREEVRRQRARPRARRSRPNESAPMGEPDRHAVAERPAGSMGSAVVRRRRPATRAQLLGVRGTLVPVGARRQRLSPDAPTAARAAADSGSARRLHDLARPGRLVRPRRPNRAPGIRRAARSRAAAVPRHGAPDAHGDRRQPHRGHERGEQDDEVPAARERRRRQAGGRRPRHRAVARGTRPEAAGARGNRRGSDRHAGARRRPLQVGSRAAAARVPARPPTHHSPQTIRDWNAGKIPVMFAHPASAGHGLNLQDGGNILEVFGHWWNLEEYMQIVERIGPVRQLQAGHRRPVFIYPIIARDTIDEDVVERRETKRAVQDILLDAMKRRAGR